MRTRSVVILLGSLVLAVGGCGGRATRNIEKLLADLASDSKRKQARAERHLAEHGRAAIKPLSAIVTGEDIEELELRGDWETLRVPAARALGLMAAKASLARSEAELAAEPLLEVLGKTDHPALRLEAAKALGHFTQLTTPVNDLILLLRESDAELVEAARQSLVRNALHAIYRLKLADEPVAAAAAKKDLARLLERLGSTDDDIRLDTVRELAASGEPRAAVLLLHRLRGDESGDVRYAALCHCRSVAEADPESDFAAKLYAQLASSFDRDDDSRVVLTAAELLSARQANRVGQFNERVARTTELVVNKLLQDAESRQYDAGARADAINALERAASKERDELLARLVDRDAGEAARIRRAAASVLATSGSSDAADALEKAMGDDDSIVRLVAATALGRGGSTEAVAYLVELLSHEEVKIRAPAADALGTLGMTALPVLVKQLEDSLVHAANLAQWEGPLRDLQRKADLTAEERDRVADLEDAIRQYRQQQPGRREKHIAWGLVTGLGRIAAGVAKENPTALAQVVEAAADVVVKASTCHYADVRRVAANALACFPGEESVAALIDALADPEDSVRWYAATALERHGQAAVPALVQALQDDGTTAIAARSLGRIGDADTLQPMLAHLPRGTGDARVALVWGIGELLRRHPVSTHAPAAREALRKTSQLPDDPEAARLARYALSKAAAPK